MLWPMRSWTWTLPAVLLLNGCAPAAVTGFPLFDAASDDAAGDAAASADLLADDVVIAPKDAAAPPDVVVDATAPTDVPTVEDASASADVPLVEDVSTPADVPAPSDVPSGPCSSSRMCPGQVCDTARSRCVDCLSEVDCAAGQRCVSNQCVAPPSSCRSDRDCSMLNQVCNLGRMLCVDCVTARDCGGGQYCTAEGDCEMQVCAPGAASCVNGTTRGVCNDDGSRRVETACPAGANAVAQCASGSCSLRCESGFADCDGEALTGCEVSLRSSSANCGSCGRRCGAEQVCTAGSCVAGPCPTGQTRCNGVCTDTSSDAANCGGCGTRCGADQLCASGSCVARPCPSGQTRCDGVCVDTSSDTRNCGGCGRACTLPICLAGSCVGGPTCGTGLTSCGTSCVNLQNDPRNCGACGRACPSGQSCQSGSCSTALRLRFSVTWSPTADIDLWVLTPSGQALNYQNRTAAGGVHGGDSRTMGPEDVIWTGTPPSGTYVMCAIPYAITRSTAVRYQIQRDGNVVSTGTRNYSSSAPSNSRCTAGGAYEVARVTW